MNTWAKEWLSRTLQDKRLTLSETSLHHWLEVTQDWFHGQSWVPYPKYSIKMTMEELTNREKSNKALLDWACQVPEEDKVNAQVLLGVFLEDARLGDGDISLDILFLATEDKKWASLNVGVQACQKKMCAKEDVYWTQKIKALSPRQAVNLMARINFKTLELSISKYILPHIQGDDSRWVSEDSEEWYDLQPKTLFQVIKKIPPHLRAQGFLHRPTLETVGVTTHDEHGLTMLQELNQLPQPLRGLSWVVYGFCVHYQPWEFLHEALKSMPELFKNDGALEKLGKGNVFHWLNIGCQLRGLFDKPVSEDHRKAGWALYEKLVELGHDPYFKNEQGHLPKDIFGFLEQTQKEKHLNEQLKDVDAPPSPPKIRL